MTAPKPRDRKCVTCRFYEPSPLWRKGWCRNTLLYDSQTNHLVEAEELSCSRTFIDYWEPRPPGKGTIVGIADGASGAVRRAPSIPMTPTGPGGAPLHKGSPTVAAIQASAQPRERPPQLSLVRPAVPPPAPAGMTPPARQETAPLPVIPPPENAASAPTTAIPLPVAPDALVIAPRPQAATAEEATEDAPNRLRMILGGAILVAGLVAAVLLLGPRKLPPAVLPTALPAAAVYRVPTATARPVAAPVVVATHAPTAVPTSVILAVGVGANVQTTGLGGAALNVRQAAGLRGRILGRLANGVTAQIKAGPQTADGGVWWQVFGWDTKGTLGWVAGKYLKAVP